MHWAAAQAAEEQVERQQMDLMERRILVVVALDQSLVLELALAAQAAVLAVT
jgi:hypothetical protein